MGLTKLGTYIEPFDERNSDGDYGPDSVVGLSTQKEIIKTKANLQGVSLDSYKLFPPDSFAFVPDTSRRGDKMSLAFNRTEETYLVSSISVVFKIKDIQKLDSTYLYIYFNRPEFDRYARFNSWGSAREAFSWEDMCDIDIDLPPIEIQQKYVDIYNSMLANQQCYERGLEDLKIVLEGYMDNLKHSEELKAIGDYIELSDERNTDLEYRLDDVRGISIEKKLIDTKADMTDVSLRPYYLLKPNYFGYVTVTSRNGEKISLALNSTENTFICSSSYVVFKTKDEDVLCPKYLMLFLNRSEFDRYSRFNSWGSARETFDWQEMCEVKIPIPDIEVQKSIANIYNVYLERKAINEKLKAQIKDICPILIKSSLEEASR